MPSGFNPLLRRSLLASRWAMAPLCLGLIAALLLVLAQFFRELIHTGLGFTAMSGSDVILAVLKLVDLVLVANLALMMISAGVEIFAPAGGDPDHPRPEWSGIVDFAALKPKLFASISAIAAIDMLESFINIESVDKATVLWEILLLLSFVVTGVLLAWMERLAGDQH